MSDRPVHFDTALIQAMRKLAAEIRENGVDKYREAVAPTLEAAANRIERLHEKDRINERLKKKNRERLEGLDASERDQ